MSRTYLKIKIKSLAAEATIIKLDERKAKADYRRKGASPSPLFWGLKMHRLEVVRIESRAALLAYGFIRGRTYRSMEAKTHSMDPTLEALLWHRAEKLARKYGTGAFDEKAFETWRSEPVKPVVTAQAA